MMRGLWRSAVTDVEVAGVSPYRSSGSGFDLTSLPTILMPPRAVIDLGRGGPHVRHGLRVPDAVHRGAYEAGQADSHVQRDVQAESSGVSRRVSARGALCLDLSACVRYEVPRIRSGRERNDR